MKKSVKTFIIILAILIVVGIIAGSYFLHNKPVSTTTPTPTTVPTNTVIPTETEKPTLVPTEALPTTEPTTEPTETVEPTATLAPTATIEPIATSTPVPTATNTPVPTSTPTPTPSPIPHVHNWEEKSVEATCAMEGKLWEECTECGEVRNELIFPKEEHKDIHNKVITSATVESEGSFGGYCGVCGELVYTGPLQKLTPTPTPTPVPDANNPRLVLSEKMGDNITFEFWDNGYLYVKGTGKTYDKKDSFHWIIISEFKGKLTKEFLSSLKHVVVEEGVTYLGENIFADIDRYADLQTITLLGTSTDINAHTRVSAKTIYCYCDGRACVMTRDDGVSVLLSFATDADDEEFVAKKKITVEWKEWK